MRISTPYKGRNIELGFQGENNAVQVQISVKDWEQLYGEGEYTLLHKRSQDPGGYPIIPIIQNGTIMWNVSSSDTQYAGFGQLQVMYIVNGNVAKSVVYNTHVCSSLDDSITPPDPWQSWVQEIVDAKEEIENMTATAEIGIPWGPLSVEVEKTEVDDHINLGFTFNGLTGNEKSTYVFEQATPATEWIIEHNTGSYPSVAIVDSGGSVIMGETIYVDDNIIKLRFNTAFSGYAYLN